MGWRTGKITGGIQYAGQTAPALQAKIKEYIGVVLDRKPGDPDQLRGEVMQLSRNIYQKNIENGLDVEPFKWGEVVLFTMLGLLAGGAAGAGGDYYLTKRKSKTSAANFKMR